MAFSLSYISPALAALMLAGIILISAIAIHFKDVAHYLLIIGLSLAFVGWLDPVSGGVLLVLAHLSYWLLTRHTRSPHLLRWFAWSSVAALLTLKFIQTYYMGGTARLVVLFGVSYYTFRIAAILFDTARTGKFEGTYLKYISYCLFFPIFTGGPVERYQHFQRLEEDWRDSCRYGLGRLLAGIIKKLFLADVLLLSLTGWLKAQAGFGTPGMDDPHLFSARPALLLFGFASILRAYVDLSAFTDLALGSARLLGYRLTENFNRPLLATNLIEFWRRWHMTIAGWAKDYIFSPLLLGTRRVALSLLTTMLFMGLWHAPALSWIFWGIGHGAGMLVCGWWQRTALHARLAKFVHPSPQSKIYHFKPRLAGLAPDLAIQPAAAARRMAGVTVSLLAWLALYSYMSVIFLFVSASSVEQAADMIAALFGFGG